MNDTLGDSQSFNKDFALILRILYWYYNNLILLFYALKKTLIA